DPVPISMAGHLNFRQKWISFNPEQIPMRASVLAKSHVCRTINLHVVSIRKSVAVNILCRRTYHYPRLVSGATLIRPPIRGCAMSLPVCATVIADFLTNVKTEGTWYPTVWGSDKLSGRTRGNAAERRMNTPSPAANSGDECAAGLPG